jgi:hypothetical protein
MTKEQFSCIQWRKSSHSGSEGQECVEVAALTTRHTGRMIGMRDSKNPDGPVLSFSLTEWSFFIEDVKHSTFNVLH